MFRQGGQAARIAAVLLLAAAIVAPTAAANRYGPLRTPESAPARQEARSVSTCHQYCGPAVRRQGSRAPAGPAIVKTELVERSDAGFHWTDAAVGFAVACGGLLLVSLTVLAGRRVRVRAAKSAS